MSDIPILLCLPTFISISAEGLVERNGCDNIERGKRKPDNDARKNQPFSLDQNLADISECNDGLLGLSRLICEYRPLRHEYRPLRHRYRLVR